jgi:hypothetical protein
MISLLLSLTLAAPFPLPAIDGKPLAITEGQKTFRIPMRFEKVKHFYVEQLGKTAEVTIAEKGEPGSRVLSLSTKSKSESWTKASVTEGQVDTLVQVTAVMRLQDENITGNGKPLVEFVFSRSADVQKAIDSIDHTEQMRSK